MNPPLYDEKRVNEFDIKSFKLALQFLNFDVNLN